MPGPLVHALKASAVPLRARRATTPRTVLARTLAHNVKGKRASPSQPATQPPEPQEHRRSWFYSANKFNQLVVIPSTYSCHTSGHLSTSSPQVPSSTASFSQTLVTANTYSVR